MVDPTSPNQSSSNASTQEGDDADLSEKFGTGLRFAETVAQFLRPRMATVIGILMGLMGAVAVLAACYLSFTLLTDDWLGFRDVFITVIAVLTSSFCFAVLMCIHGVNVFQEAREATKAAEEPVSTTILRAMAGGMRGWGEAFFVAVIVAIPFVGVQALIADRSMAMMFFAEGLIGIVIMPMVWAVSVLLFTYLATELIETIIGIRENTE